MIVKYYPSTKNAYMVGDIATWAKKNKCNYVIEIHRNAGGGVGSEILIQSGSPADKMDKAVYNAIIKQGYKGRGIKSRGDLGNMNRMASSGISYSLLEIGFIDSKTDNSIFDKTVTSLGYDIYDALSNAGVKTLGVVYGHGQGDPGACKYGREESIDVRKIKIKRRIKPMATQTKQRAILTFKHKNGYNYYIDTIIGVGAGDVPSGANLLDKQHTSDQVAYPFQLLTTDRAVTFYYKYDNENKTVSQESGVIPKDDCIPVNVMHRF